MAKKKTKIKKTSFTFWRENRKSNEYQMDVEDIKTLYRDWIQTKDIEWIEYYGHTTVQSFITDPLGLNSTFDHNELDDLHEALQETRRAFYAK